MSSNDNYFFIELYLYSSQQGWGKRVKQSTEKDSETRERVESQLFEL